MIDISNNHSDFKSKLNQLEVSNWVLLMQCPDCKQFYKIDEWDKYQSCYAMKIPSSENWKSFNPEPIIKKELIKNRGGLTNKPCIWAGCDIKQVKGSAYCVNHLYEAGARA